MKRRYLIVPIVVVLLLLITFFFPKRCGTWGTWVNQEARYKDCTCFGLKYREPALGGGDITCFGIATSYSCYYYELKEEADQSQSRPQRINVPCE